jgi:nucleotide-binding universal stress UspA family protein
MTQLSPTGRFEKLLLSTDGSEFSEGATRLALQLAKNCGATLHVMTMVMTNPEYETLAPHLVEKAEQDAGVILNAVRQQAEAQGVACQTQVYRGDDPADETLAAAEALSADAIIMGRRGKRKLARWMVGHATVKVIGGAHRPVLVVPRAAAVPSRRILLATDGSRYSDNAAANAAKLANLCQLSISVVSAVAASHSQARRDEAQQAVERVTQLLAQDGVDCEGLVLEGKPDEVIVNTAQQKGADMIVVGSRGRTGLERILVGSVSERVIGLAECATLVACL